MKVNKLFFLIIAWFISIVGILYAQNIEKLRVKIKSVDFTEDNTSFILRVFSDKNLIYTSYTEDNPPRLIIELPVVDFGNLVGEKRVDKDLIRFYKISQLGRNENYTGRIEISFLKKAEYAIERLAQGITVYIKKESAISEEKVSKEAVTINNMIYSGDNKKFVTILETSGKPEALNYVLKNPLRLVFDIHNSKYNLQQKNFLINNTLVKSIRVEPFPNLTRLFIDINSQEMPAFISKSEANKLIIELSIEEKEKKEERVTSLTLDTVDYKPEGRRNIFRFKNIGDADYKVYKLSDMVLVFEFKGVRLDKGIQKTYDVKEVSNLLNNFTLYQVKPEEENRVRFVAILKEPISYETKKEGRDIVVEFSKEVAKEEKTIESVKTAITPTPSLSEQDRKKDFTKVEEKPKEDFKAKDKEVVVEQVKKEEKIEMVEQKKVEEKPKQEVSEKKVSSKVDDKKEEKATALSIEEKPKEIQIPKEEPKLLTVKKEDRVEPEKKLETKKEEKIKETIITIKPKEQADIPEPKDEKPKQQVDSKYKGRPITINLKDAEIQHIFKLLTEVAKLDGEILNIVTSDDVKGRLSIQLEEVPWDQVLDVVMEVNNLGMKRIGNIIRVMPKDRLKKEQEDLLAASKIKEKVENLVLEIVPINYVEANDFVDKIKPLLSSRGSVTVDKRNNSLIINDIKDNIDEAKKLIAKLDTPPQQVVIEARVVEASSDFSKEMGIQWGFKMAQTIGDRYRGGVGGPIPSNVGNMGSLDLTGTNVTPVPYMVNLPAAVGAGAGGGINFALVNLRSGAGLDIQLTAMENKGIGKILSRPKITTLNNVEANIQQGSSIPYETLSDKGTQTQFIDASLQLTVTPRITPDNSIILKVKVSNNNPNTALRSAGGVPSIDKNEATTEILVRDGQTIVIGGIIRNKETVSKAGVPFLMDIPLIGWLFKKEAKSVENRELLIFLTPSIIKNIKEVDAS